MENYQKLYDWYENLRDKEYRLIGLANVISHRKTEYRWGEEALKYKLKHGQSILVYQRRSTTRK
jgi:hypothetical protein